MGLGLSVASAIPRRGLLRRPPTRERLFQELSTAIGAFARRQPPPLNDWHWTSSSEEVLYVSLVPCEEHVEFRLVDGRLACEAKTSTAGPGYHAYLVDLLDALRDGLGLDWSTGADEDDETGYLVHRDFARLQADMAAWLRELGRIVLERAATLDPPLLLGMSLEFRPVTDAFAASQMGEWGRDWFEHLAAAGDAEVGRLAEQFFPWWERGVTAKTLRGLGLARAWVDVPWVAPEDEDARRLCASVLDCFVRARELDPGLALPEAELRELASLLVPGAPLRAPSAQGVGFLRRELVRPLTGTWSIELPGFWHADLEDEGGTRVYWFGGRTVRGSSITVQARSPRTPQEVLGAPSTEKGERPLTMRGQGLAGKCAWKPAQGEEGFVLTAEVASQDGLCIVSIYVDDESERAWAESVAVTVRAGTFGGPD